MFTGNMPEQISPSSSKKNKKYKTRSLKIYRDIKRGILDSKEN